MSSYANIHIIVSNAIVLFCLKFDLRRYNWLYVVSCWKFIVCRAYRPLPLKLLLWTTATSASALPMNILEPPISHVPITRLLVLISFIWISESVFSSSLLFLCLFQSATTHIYYLPHCIQTWRYISCTFYFEHICNTLSRAWSVLNFHTCISIASVLHYLAHCLLDYWNTQATAMSCYMFEL